MDEGVRCKAMSKQTGERCKKLAIPGGTVCVVHGGSAPAAKMAAQRRLIAMIDPAMTALLRAIRECDEWPTKVRAAIAVLDRAGFGPTQSLRVDEQANDLAALSSAELKARAMHIVQRAAAAEAKELEEPLH
jgi:hypothetical protein